MYVLMFPSVNRKASDWILDHFGMELVDLAFVVSSETNEPLALDYPPFFAYFEKLLSIPASFIDPKIVQLDNLNYDAWSVVVFQRLTVIFSELVLGFALLRLALFTSALKYRKFITFARFTRSAVDPSIQRVISASLFLHPGFLIVDHIHFQYNGFMFGILLWSILMAQQVSVIMALAMVSSLTLFS